MRRNLPLSLFFLTMSFLTVVAVAGCARSEAASEPAASHPAAEAARPPAPPSARAPQGALPRLVFFQNPNGRPCQMQQRILDGLTAELDGKVELVSYRTTTPEDREMFGQFGIRSLPALVLTDAAGAEVRRATPGIQDSDAVRRLIGQ